MMRTRDEGRKLNMRLHMGRGYTNPRCCPTFSYFFLAARHPIFSMGMLTAWNSSRPGHRLFWAIVTAVEANQRGKAHQEDTRRQYPNFECYRLLEAARREVVEAAQRIGAQVYQDRCKAKWAKLFQGQA